MTPNYYFKDLDEAKAMLKEWQERLFLTDWMLTINIVQEHEMALGPNFAGECHSSYINRSATINILCAEHQEKNCTVSLKMPHEQILIHELLHLKFPEIVSDSPSRETAVFEANEHAFIEELSKSFFMTKYDLPFSYFRKDDK